MKWYVVIIQNNSTQAVYTYDSYDSALSAFHNELAYRGDGRTSSTCVVLDEQGNTHAKEYWKKNAEET